MQTVKQLPSKQAQEALKILDAAWAYYTPQVELVLRLNQPKDDRPESPFVPYYSAA